MSLRREDVLGVVLIAGALVAMAAVIVATKTLKDRQVRLDARGCPIESGAPTIDAVLYDASDELSSVQLDWTRQRLSEWTRSIPKSGNLKIYVLSGQPSAMTPRFDRCNPGSGDDESFWIANPDKLKRRWQTIFRVPAVAEIEGLPLSVMAESPLLESIQSLGVRGGLGAQYRPERREGARRTAPQPTRERRLLLVSDLLQHSQAISLYRSGCAATSTFIGSPSWHAIRGDLTGLEVSVLLVRRAGTRVCEERDLIRWWDAVLKSLGASLAAVEPLPGLAPASSVPGGGR